MVKYGRCDQCDRQDITAYEACEDLDLCPKCLSGRRHTPESTIRTDVSSQLTYQQY